MNQIYKVIWSRVKRCYVVVSEVAGRCGKNGAASEKESLPFRAFLCALAITGCLMPGVAEANTVHGPGAAATGSGSTAVGDNTKAKGNNAVAVGPLTNADGENSLAAGYDAKTGSTAENSVAIGRGARALGQKRAGDQFTASTIAIGNVATAAENGDIVIGRQAKSTVSEYHTHPQGGNGAVVMGAEAASYGSRGDVVIGAGAEACLLRKDVTAPADKPEYSQGVAIGSRAKVYGTQSTSIGADSRSIGHSSIAIGGDDIDRAKPVLQAAIPDMATTGVQKNFNRELAVLYPGTTLGSAAINDSKNYVNTASIGNASMAIGMMTQSYGTGSTAIGVNTLTKGIASTGIGVMARSWGDKSLALGSRAETYGNKSTAVGDANTVGFDMTDGTTSGAASSAVGTDNKVYGNNSYAIGGGNTIGSATITETTEANGDKIKKVTAGTVKGNTAGAFGYKNTVTTDNAYVVGNNSTASADGAMVLGSSASVTGKNGVALGNNTKVANENAVAIGNGSETAAAVATPSATINGVAHNFAGVNPASTVSVGKAGAERTITNVAAGRISATSTDAINGSQLYAVTSEVDKGLRFDADNNSEKTNKLGSKVTVNGDNNITTEITQTGDDTKIGVKLNQDINVKTVTATDTVKAGGVTMGGQTVANAAGANETGNYVTGLDNKTWNIQNPNVVSGRGATEDQLKVVSDEVKKQGANATDYRLVQNASSADGSYTVDTNGDIDLTVEDKNHAGQKETVKLKDIASKSKLDDVINKGLQFDANVGGVQTNKLGSKITVKGEGTAADTDYSGENLKTFITQDPAGNTTIDVKMNKNLKVETVVATGENGKDGKIGINGKDGQTTNISVTRDGKPGVDGAPGTTTTRIVYEKPDGTKEEVATLNDGMKYGGDTGAVIKKKLNEQVNVVGGITDTNKLTTEDNLGVVSDGSNNLKVRLAKALKGLESVTTGDTVMNNSGVTINNGAAGNPVSLTKNGLDNGGNKITNVAAGVNGTDAVNVNQLNTVAGEAAKHTTVKAKDSNVTITEGTNAAGGKEYTVGLGDKVTLGSDPSKQVSIDGTTGIIKAGDKVTIDGTTGNIDAGKVKINGKDGTVNELTNKTWDPNNITSGQAATEDQLKEVDNKITNTSTELTNKGMDFAGNDGEFHRNLGEKVTIKGEGTKAASEYSGENIRTFADANGNVVVKMDKNLKADSLAINGQNGQDGAAIKGGTGKAGVDGTNITRLVIEEKNGTQHDIATLDDGMKYGGDTGAVIKKKLNEQVNVVGGITDTNKLTTEDNLGVVSDGNNNLKVRMAKDLKGLNSVTTNTLTVGDVKIDNSGINAGNKKITNVAAGDISANSTDAVNGGQLWKTNQTINNIGGAVNELGDRMDRVGAGAAALAALHPLDFDPDDKWDVAAGYGNYKDAHAIAVGAFYRPNEDTMFSVGGSFGGGENMVNAGVSVKLGQGNHVSTSRVALAKEVEDLKAIVKAQSAEIKAMRGAMQSGTSVMKDVNFPDVSKDHWAYSYVKSLADRGLLEGYPDGEFKGDRTMTRYEFAAIIYRALQNGAPIDSDMAKAIGEFDPEINRIKDLDRTRVDRISGKDNDRHKVERVRVNNESNKEKGDYRDVYGSHISPEA
ncbi:ESPR-type extended signal peptide-containing protein [Dialister invisus]|uniref:ESPR-type extended signal peptide-containing protein n=2 Tax=Dialister invisus TaxID=218538 RepID=UPI0023F3CC2A|nr:ESPR-type extended signal peptide-containing protein [Dialister invisus]MBS6200000.1 S-layer homology domain-containing protein [Dialister invisus]